MKAAVLAIDPHVAAQARDPDAEAYIARMKRIDGWLSREDAQRFVGVDAVQRNAGVDGDLIEIGTWHGRGAILFHHLLRETEKAYAVDIFDLRNRDHPYFNDPARLRAHAAAFGCDERLVEIRMDTARHAYRLIDVVGMHCIRIAHVDGGHDYAVVRRDIEVVARLLRDEGVIAFDDFFNRRCPGTTQAIIEFLLHSRQFVPFMLTTKKLWVCRREWHDAYSRHFATGDTAYGRTTLLDSKVLLDPAIR